MSVTPLLNVRDLSVCYGAVKAVREVSIDVGPEEVVAVLGTNGAGKTTLLRAISGAAPITKGEITLDGKSLVKFRPDQALRAGVAHVLEGRHVFPNMTVEENLQIGCTVRDDDPAEDLDRLYSAFPTLGSRLKLGAGNLSGGQQQMLVTARALLSRPRLLLLDEPSLGLAPIMLETVADLVDWARREMGVAVLVVEQHTALALAMADRAYVMSRGEVVLEGTPEDLTESSIRQAFMGGSDVV